MLVDSFAICLIVLPLPRIKIPIRMSQLPKPICLVILSLALVSRSILPLQNTGAITFLVHSIALIERASWNHDAGELLPVGASFCLFDLVLSLKHLQLDLLVIEIRNALCY